MRARGGNTFLGGQRTKIIVVGVIVLLAVIGVWTQHALQESITTSLTQALGTVLEADVKALKFWVKNETSDVKAWAGQPQLRKLARELTDIAQQNPVPRQALLDSPLQSALRTMLQSLTGTEDHPGFMLIDRKGLIVAASVDESVGLSLSPEGVAIVTRAFQNEPFMTKPYRQESLIAGFEGTPAPPKMAVIAPVFDEHGNPTAALMLLIRPEEDFTRILSVAWLGDHGDTYAFDEQGVMLSDTRHVDQLKTLGILPDTPNSGSILQVRIRNPGRDLTQRSKPDTPLAARPLTKLVASAIAGQDDTHIVLKPYRDYRGVLVVGASRWLSEYGFGVATEIELKKALAPLRPARWASYALFGVIVASAVALIFSSLFIGRLRRRVRDVEQLGQYTLEKKIGEGGMGKVYLARHAMLRRPTAVKFLHPEHINPEAIARFEREVQLTSQLTHPNTVEIYDYGHTQEGIFYYAMEYLPGITLSKLIEMDGALPPERVIYILKQVCASLHEAHGIGLIHRDIKPLNIMLCQRGGRADVIKVLDFGLVKDIFDRSELELTTMQVIPGTPSYVAPERLQNPLDIDARADLYCVGAVGFNLLTGQDVFEGSTAMEITAQVLSSPPRHPQDLVKHEIPQALDQLIVDCLAKNPDDRPHSAKHIIERLENIQGIQGWGEEQANRWWQDHAEEIRKVQKTDMTIPGTQGHESLHAPARFAERLSHTVD